jgi:hypothetical protein
MEYRAVFGRCAVDRSDLPDLWDEVLKVLRSSLILPVDVDMIDDARRYCLGKPYKRGAQFSDTPRLFDCSTLTKYLYGIKGIWLPRKALQQRRLGWAVPTDSLAPGDLVFGQGHLPLYDHDPADGVGHVVVATGTGTVIHAANAEKGVVEEPIEPFLRPDYFRGAKRYCTPDTLTLQVPGNLEIETSDDVVLYVRNRLARAGLI